MADVLDHDRDAAQAATDEFMRLDEHIPGDGIERQAQHDKKVFANE